MNTELQHLLITIVKNGTLHGMWLNTLSYLENCGARKIASCEHPTLVREEMLKHASEEFRHAHYLKKQIKKVTQTPFLDYSLSNLLGGTHSKHYLNRLDIMTYRYLLKKERLPPLSAKAIAYLLVTYTIELRAEVLYSIYEGILREHHLPVFVRSILLEEEGHLAQMRQEISSLPLGGKYVLKAQEYEHKLFQGWLARLTQTVYRAGEAPLLYP